MAVLNGNLKIGNKYYVNAKVNGTSIYDNPSVAVNSTTKSITVPSSKLTDASVLSVGGKSMVVNQLVNTDTTSVATISGHKYYTNISSTESVITSDGTALAVTGGTDKVTDLTLAFGTDAPSSTSDSRITWLKTYLLSHPEYNAGSVISADVSSLTSKSSEAVTIDTLTIPQSVRNLEGYGVGLDASTYNYVDFGLRKFVKAVTSQNITGASGDEIALAGCDTSATTYMCAKGDIGTLSNGTLTLTSDVTNVAVYYKLATAVETDISSYLTDTTIQTQAGGSITFENGNNLDVPSGMKYWNYYGGELHYGMTTQAGVPDLDHKQDFINSNVVVINGVIVPSTDTIPVTLRAVKIPSTYASYANLTDGTNYYVADTYDPITHEYIKRIKEVTMTGVSPYNFSGYVRMNTNAFLVLNDYTSITSTEYQNNSIRYTDSGLCNYAPPSNVYYDSMDQLGTGIYPNGRIIFLTAFPYSYFGYEKEEKTSAEWQSLANALLVQRNSENNPFIYRYILATPITTYL